ncbi:MAG: hypothetical protein P0107_04645 [Nitrosomonas sp.]|nr:hypothetical protein [Nitrosomonas sp.]
MEGNRVSEIIDHMDHAIPIRIKEKLVANGNAHRHHMSTTTTSASRGWSGNQPADGDVLMIPLR